MKANAVVLYDSTGSSIALGKKLASGGEGEVFEMSDATLVAKIYKLPIKQEKQMKLQVMVQHSDLELRKIAAWPTALLFDSKRNVCGFIMDKIADHKPIYELCNPSARKRHFPDKDYLFLLFCIRNIIVAFRTIHGKGIIVGDVNESNIVVSDKGLIKFIDCDSFQISHSTGHYACEVGVPLYTPPELHSALLSSIIRTENHDIFGMAVLCFQLMFMGRHPYVGIYNGPEIPFEKEIQLFRFAYGTTGLSKGIRPPEGALPFDSIPPGLQRLFDHSFSERGVSGRPPLASWFNEIDDFLKHLSVCSKDQVHKYYSGLKQCPWCSLEDKKGLYFFIKSRILNVGFNFNLNQLWSEIQGLTLPDEELSFTAHSFSLSPSHNKMELKFFSLCLKVQRIMAWIIPFAALFINGTAFVISIPIAIAIYHVGLFHKRVEKERDSYRKILNEKNNNYQYQMKRWSDEASPTRFIKIKSDIEQVVKKYQRLPNDYSNEKARLYSEREFHQLQNFLDRFYIRNYSIPHIKEARKITLRSFGIETAADVLGMSVPGFGPFLIGELMAWRKTLERKFKFDPSLDVDQEHLNSLNQKFDKMRANYERQLLGGIEELRQVRKRVLSARSSLRESASIAAKEYYQEEMNFKDLFG